jgi:hypothetical protein
MVAADIRAYFRNGAVFLQNHDDTYDYARDKRNRHNHTGDNAENNPRNKHGDCRRRGNGQKLAGTA